MVAYEVRIAPGTDLVKFVKLAKEINIWGKATEAELKVHDDEIARDQFRYKSFVSEVQSLLMISPLQYRTSPENDEVRGTRNAAVWKNIIDFDVNEGIEVGDEDFLFNAIKNAGTDPTKPSMYLDRKSNAILHSRISNRLELDKNETWKREKELPAAFRCMENTYFGHAEEVVNKHKKAFKEIKWKDKESIVAFKQRFLTMWNRITIFDEYKSYELVIEIWKDAVKYKRVSDRFGIVESDNELIEMKGIGDVRMYLSRYVKLLSRFLEQSRGIWSFDVIADLSHNVQLNEPKGNNIRQQSNDDAYDCKKCGRRHKRRSCPAFGKNCFTCNGKGHFSSQCRKKQSVNNVDDNETQNVTTKNEQQDESDSKSWADWVHCTILDSTEETVNHESGAIIEDDFDYLPDGFDPDDLVVNNTVDDDDYTWALLDTGSTTHVVNDKRYCSTYYNEKSEIKATGTCVLSTGRGDVPIRLSGSENTFTCFMKDARIVPDTPYPIISWSKIIKGIPNACLVIGQYNGYISTNHQKNRIRLVVRGGLYFVKLKFMKTKGTNEIVHNTLDDMHHRRLCHASNEILKRTLGKEIIENKECEVCLKAKVDRASDDQALTKFKTEVSERMERVHIDILVSNEASINNTKLILVLVDAYSKYVFGVEIKNKGSKEVIKKLDPLFAKYQTPKLLIADRDSPFISGEFSDWCCNKKIELKFVPPDRHNFNGLAENAIKLIKRWSTCIRLDAKLPKEFWNWSVLYTIGVRNRTANSSIQYRSPYEMFYNKKADLEFLRRFGSVAYYRLLDNPKMEEARGVGLVMKLDFDSTHGTYILYCLKNKTFIRRYHVDVKIKEELNWSDLEDKANFQNIHNTISCEVKSPFHKVKRMDREKIMELVDDKRRKALLADEPYSYDDIEGRPDKELWYQACQDELKSMEELKVFVPVPKTTENGSEDVAKCGFVFKRKRSGRLKARLVYKGHTQRLRVFDDHSSPTVSPIALRIALSIAANEGWGFFTLDVKTAYLTAPLPPSPKMLMELPNGHKLRSTHWGLMLKAMYGMRGSSRAWYNELLKTLFGLGVKQSIYEPCVLYAHNIIIL
ncbi:MAG: reverse transcriptase domain-containing protein, partial [Saprospiraceae bacterium]